jgi:hypothetical protein
MNNNNNNNIEFYSLNRRELLLIDYKGKAVPLQAYAGP